MNVYRYTPVIMHHGILGMKWGVRHDRRSTPSNSRQSSKDNKNPDNGRKPFDKKKAIKIGAAVAGTALLTAGAIYMVKSGKLDKLVKLGQNRSKTVMDAMGDLVNSDGKVSKSSSPLSFSAKYINSTGSDNNCMDVSEATLKRYLGVDANAKAGTKTVAGRLSDFIRQRNYNSSGIKDLSGEAGFISPGKTGEETRQRLENRILRKCKDGDVGMLSVKFDVNKLDVPDSLKQYYKSNPEKSPGHAFCFGLFNGSVVFTDNQHENSQSKIQKFFDAVDPRSGIEIFQIDERAFKG